MLFKSRNIELPRRVAAYYLLFGLAAVVWLGIGIVVVSQSVHDSRAESTRVNQLGRAAATIKIEFLRRGDTHLQPLVTQIQQEYGFADCAVVSNAGIVLAHTLTGQIGQPTSEPQGAIVRWGEVQRIRFVDSSSRVMHEYRVPLNSDGKTLGTLRASVADTGLWGTIRSTAQLAPYAVIAPLLLTGFGGIVIHRMLRPYSEIESQLRQAAVAPTLVDFRLHDIQPRGPAALGWNRLVDVQGSDDQEDSLEARMNRVLKTAGSGNLDDALHTLPQGVATTDADGTITFTNRAMGALLGKEDDDGLYGKSMESCLEALVVLPEKNPFADGDSQLRTVTAECQGTNQFCHTVFRVTRHPVRTANGQTHNHHVWTLLDITQQKLAEETRDQFVNTATHELRTPLANIKAYAETLALSDLNDVEQQKTFLNTINSEATRLARFVDDLLSISSMEVGSLSIARQETDVERMLRECIEKIQSTMDQKQIVFEASLPQKLPKISLDKDKISASLINLLGNAAKYTPSGGTASLRVRATNDELHIEVADTGAGISEEELPKVFDKFFRSQDPRVQAETGTGLGLSLANEIVRLHGGKLTAVSKFNEGSTFAMILPIR